MDLGLRDWLLILGPVFIAGILIHGYWRMRSNRSNLKMALDKSFLSEPVSGDGNDDFSMLRAELPNGGARVLDKPEQTSLNLDENVPVLMDSVESSADKLPLEDFGAPIQPNAAYAQAEEKPLTASRDEITYVAGIEEPFAEAPISATSSHRETMRFDLLLNDPKNLSSSMSLLSMSPSRGNDYLSVWLSEI